MKELLQPLIEAKKFKMTRALRVLREAGWLKNLCPAFFFGRTKDYWAGQGIL